MSNVSRSTPSSSSEFSTAGRPAKQGLYDPWFEHDACGVGFVADLQGRKSHAILQQALQVLTNLDHRGAAGSEPNTGDGAGVLLQLPHKFFQEVSKKARIMLPAAGQYGAGIIFLPRNPTVRREDRADLLERIVQARGPDLPRKLAHGADRQFLAR